MSDPMAPPPAEPPTGSPAGPPAGSPAVPVPGSPAEPVSGSPAADAPPAEPEVPKRPGPFPPKPGRRLIWPTPQPPARAPVSAPVPPGRPGNSPAPVPAGGRHSAAPRPKRRVGWLVTGIVAGVLALCCVGGLAFMVVFAEDEPTSEGAAPAPVATAPTVAPSAAPSTRPAGTPQPDGSRYAQPGDRCDVIDPSMLDPRAGRPDLGVAFSENIHRPLNGCRYTLSGEGFTNDLKFFAFVGDEADVQERFEFVADTTDDQIVGLRSGPVPGIGTAAYESVFLPEDRRRIQYTLYVRHGNLFLQVSFLVNEGPWTWDLAQVRDDVTAMLRQAMVRMPRA